jgi:ketol-acid reductoisomerase
MKPGATLGLSHGFLLGVMQSDNVSFRKDINVVLVAPKVRCVRGGRPCVLQASLP